MKNFILIIVFASFVLSCGARKTAKSDFQFLNGWYFVTEEATHTKPIKNRFSEEVVYVATTPIIEASAYSKMAPATRNWGGKESFSIDLFYEDEEKEQWANATERMSKTSEMAVFIYQDTFISKVSAFRRMDNGYAGISNENFTETMVNSILADLKKQK